MKYVICQDSLLKLVRPDTNWTCIDDPEKLSLISKKLEIELIVESSYFDNIEYDTDPIKKVQKTYVHQLG